MLDQKPILAKKVKTIPIQIVSILSKKYKLITEIAPIVQNILKNFFLFPV
jgi:hypothetical protein